MDARHWYYAIDDNCYYGSRLRRSPSREEIYVQIQNKAELETGVLWKGITEFEIWNYSNTLNPKYKQPHHIQKLNILDITTHYLQDRGSVIELSYIPIRYQTNCYFTQKLKDKETQCQRKRTKWMPRKRHPRIQLAK
jgi:hypothetical protein